MTARFGFHPKVAHFLKSTFGEPTEAQRLAWPLIRSGQDTLVAAPTGSGKTLCAFLSAINDLVVQSEHGPLPEETQVLYVSPLKALSKDIELNLQAPLARIYVDEDGLLPDASPITTAVRTGDTAAKDRTRQTNHPAHIFVTTPESLYVLLTSEGGRNMLKTVRTVIVDEIHALVRDKRGAHLALSLERLDELLAENGRSRAQRIGLSATQRPVEKVATFLVGNAEDDTARPCAIVDVGHQRPMDLNLEVPDAPLEAVMSAECWTEIYDRLAQLITAHRTTLIFTNTRRLAERITRFLSERLGREAVTSHHGSLSKERRQEAEQALKQGKLRALVATASLELGIDVGDVDLVCQIGSPRSIATLLQRVGRSGHFVGGTPKGRVFPLSRDDLVECTALLQAIRLHELDQVLIPDAPLDVLSQQIVASVVPHELSVESLYRLCRRATPYRTLDLTRFMELVNMLAEGFSTARGRRGAYLHFDGVGGRIKARRNARLTAITNGGAIADNFDYDVILEPVDTKVGTVHEDFAVEASPGDVFQLGNTSYQITKVESGAVRVVDAQGAPPSLPFWLGEAPGRSDELSFAVARLRERAATLADFQPKGPDRLDLQRELQEELRLPENAALQVAEYLLATYLALGHMPTQKKLVAERFFDEAGGMHVVIHSPFGTRFNRGFGLALRKRFCRSFNVELQAAISDDAIVLSLGPMHSFPLHEVFGFLRPGSVRQVLTQAVLDSPLFGTRFRWNASRALAVQRFRGGRKVAPRFQRMDSDDLLAVCFPDQVACLENIVGERSIPDHPLVTQTIHDCLTEAMDIEQLEAVLSQIESGAIEVVARDVTEPSPLAHEVLNAKPYAFLDDAPLEERRTQAVSLRRFLDASSATDLGQLSPQAIAQVIADVSPAPRDADELHDALLVFGVLTAEEMQWPELAGELVRAGRAVCLSPHTEARYIAQERVALFAALWPQALGGVPAWERGEALREAARGRAELCGPLTVTELATALCIAPSDAEAALLALESEGFVLRGQFRTPAPVLALPRPEEFCERRLLARIHRLTLNALRREIEPVSQSVFVDFLTRYQGLHPETKRQGVYGTLAALKQLSGWYAPAGVWEPELFTARVAHYRQDFLDRLCQSGELVWCASLKESNARTQLSKATPLVLVPRDEQDLWLTANEDISQEHYAADLQRILDAMARAGALFIDDIGRLTRLLPTQIESALAQGIAAGILTCDGIDGLRYLLTPEAKRGNRTPRPHARRRGSRSGSTWQAAGRFCRVLRAPIPQSALEREEYLEALALRLLERWGVVFRKVIELENLPVGWGELRRIYHRLEARGEIRGGRFVTHFSGEQFASKDALAQLRRLRNNEASKEFIVVSACDPLNVAGHLLPGERIARIATNRLVLRGGQLIATLIGGNVAFAPAFESQSTPAELSQLRGLLRRAGPGTRAETTPWNVELPASPLV